jgi:hypothetical protein
MNVMSLASIANRHRSHLLFPGITAYSPPAMLRSDSRLCVPSRQAHDSTFVIQGCRCQLQFAGTRNLNSAIA